MLIRFYTVDKDGDGSMGFVNAFKQGVPHEVIHTPSKGTIVGDEDLAVVIGVRNVRRTALLNAACIPWLYFDKGYYRKWPDWFRVSINAHHPTAFLRPCQPDRALVHNWKVKPMVPNPDGHVLVAGWSGKAAAFSGIPWPTGEVEKWIKQLRRTQWGDRIWYRPKTSWQGKQSIEGARYVLGGKGRPIREDLEGAYCMITNASNACVDALLAGVPAIVVGNGITSSISSRKLSDITNLRYTPVEQAQALMDTIAYWQWSQEELRHGAMWAYLKRFIPWRRR